MKLRLFTIAALLTGALIAPAVSQARPAPASAIAGDLADQSLLFVGNAGQFDADIRFQVRGASGAMFLTDDAIWLTVLDPATTATRRPPVNPASYIPGSETETSRARPPSLRGVNVKLSFVGANSHPTIEPFHPGGARMSFFRGDRSRWRADVPTWGGVRYRDLYPGIDLELSGARGRLEQTLSVRPGADLNSVRLRVAGAEARSIEGNAIHLRTAVGDIALPLFRVVPSVGTAPELRTPALEGTDISAPFAQSAVEPQGISTQAAADLNYGTFLGGQFDEIAWSIDVDTTGAAYVTGQTFSPDFPTKAGSWDTECGSDGSCDNFNDTSYWHDAFVAKLNPAGTGLVYATFLGGQFGDYGYSIAVDTAGSAYVTGQTFSPDFPTTSGAFDEECGNDDNCGIEDGFYYWDGFIAKLSPDGTSLSYSTFFGGGINDWGLAITIDGNRNAYVTGRTFAPDFPTTSGAFDEECGTDGECDVFNGNYWSDAFALKLNAAGSDLVYSTYIGASYIDTGYGITVDGSGAAYVTGNTVSHDFPTTTGDQTCGSDGACNDDGTSVYYDGFVVKLNVAGSELVYGTFLGGNNGDGGYSIAVDQSNYAYVSGYTFSTSSLPVTSAGFDRTPNGVDDAFVAKIKIDGSGLVYGTLLGGDSSEGAWSIAVDGVGNAYAAGYTFSAGFPTTGNAFDLTIGGGDDAFVVKLNPAGTEPLYATFVGGGSIDEALAIALGPGGSIYIAGLTSSANLPVSGNAFDKTYAGNTCGVDPDSYPCVDAFVVKLVPKSQNPRAGRVFMPAMRRVILTLCDDFEPNDDRRSNPRKIDAGPTYSAKICANDQDNYFFDLGRNAKPTITVGVPAALRGKLSVWVYAQSDLGNTLCGYGETTVTPTIVVNSCGVFAPGRYIVRLYTDNPATDFDRANPYTLRITT